MAHKLVFTPLSYVGKDVLRYLREEINRFTPKKIIMITDPILVELGVIDKITAAFHADEYSIAIFSEVEPEPSLQLAETVVDFVREEKGNLIIGIGGGSALDLAKGAAVLSANEGLVADYLDLTGTKEIYAKGLPKILLPTTSGTGSEVTNITVLSLGQTKDVVTDDYLLADATIIDPALTLTLPKRATSGYWDGCINTRNRSIRVQKCFHHFRCISVICREIN